jgi:small-conductance mechanosensitive channel
LIALVLRSATVSRRVRGRLLTSCVVFATSAAAAALVKYAPLTPAVVDEIQAINPLLLTFGVINVLVVLAINPWREHRVPDQFPTIVQDAIVIGLFALAAVLFMQEKILATTAVGAVVIGFALQDTLGNLFAGLAIPIEKPFRVGHWVTIGGIDGAVTEVTWRARRSAPRRAISSSSRTAWSPRRRSRSTRSRRRTRGSRWTWVRAVFGRAVCDNRQSMS